MSLHKALVQWDGKSKDTIIEIYHRFYQGREFIAQLLKLSTDVTTKAGATWLLKHHLENNPRSKVNEKTFFMQLFAELQPQAKLHLLQCLPYVNISKAHKKPLEVCLKQALVDDSKDMRVWAYNGFNELALSHHEYRQQADAILVDALGQESASIKTRVRNIIKELSILERD
ncbi:MAG: hypothetical protein P8N51_13235 [Pseudomonadales bacterium]|nr:hypothetical protein [Pseudomonadales bacterium]MDG1441666.1 hypothetical protein [Pseudomonadales bacterium]